MAYKIGNPLQTETEEDYWNNDPRYTNTLPTVSVTTPVKSAGIKSSSNTWLWALGIGAAALLFTKGKLLK